MLRNALTVGKIAGIPVRFHWSWVVVLVILVAVLGQFYAPGSGGWALAVAAVALLCLSVVLHELGHALVARYYRLPVRGITLFALGGVTEISDEHLDPVSELLIAVAGPAVSLALAAVATLVWWQMSWLLPGVLVLHLALTNGLMAIFNLLPGYPMDGGRVLRAVIWFLLDDELPAARIASQAGQVCGGLIIALSIAYAFGTGDLIDGAWMVLVGYFLIRSASVGYRQLMLQRILSGVSVGDLMQRAYRAVEPELPLDQFVGRYVLGQVEQGFPVLQQPNAEAPQQLLGMMTLRDLRRFTLKEWAFTHVGEAMTPAHRIRALAPQTSAGEALRTLVESGEEQLPVIDENALQGVLRKRDLVRYIHMRLTRP
jgi:Zn-dependent protease/CBS domain-containing protein